jgi:hypothetical protein
MSGSGGIKLGTHAEIGNARNENSGYAASVTHRPFETSGWVERELLS